MESICDCWKCSTPETSVTCAGHFSAIVLYHVAIVSLVVWRQRWEVMLSEALREQTSIKSRVMWNPSAIDAVMISFLLTRCCSCLSQQEFAFRSQWFATHESQYSTTNSEIDDPSWGINSSSFSGSRIFGAADCSEFSGSRAIQFWDISENPMKILGPHICGYLLLQII